MKPSINYLEAMQTQDRAQACQHDWEDVPIPEPYTGGRKQKCKHCNSYAGFYFCTYYEVHQFNDHWIVGDRRNGDIEAVDSFETLDEALLYIENDRAERKAYAARQQS